MPKSTVMAMWLDFSQVCQFLGSYMVESMHKPTGVVTISPWSMAMLTAHGEKWILLYKRQQLEFYEGLSKEYCRWFSRTFSRTIRIFHSCIKSIRLGEIRMAISVSFTHTESKEAERTSSIEEDCIANGGFIMFPLRFDCTLFYDKKQNFI